MGNGADIAIEVSDIILLDDTPKALRESFQISKVTFKKVKQNLTFSIIYNLFAVPLAVMGYVNPLVSAFSMSLSSLIVVANSMRIKIGVWVLGDSNPGPLGYEPSALTG